MLTPTPLQDNEVLVFIHIPKTAGTSLGSLLQSHFSPSEVLQAPIDIIEANDEPSKFLSSYRLINGHNPYRIEAYLRKDPVFITMLRNPIERTISAYYHAQHDKEHDFHQLALDHNLESYLKLEVVRNAGSNIMSRYLFNDAPWYEISEHMPTVKQRIVDMRFIGITEFFDESVILLNHIMGWQNKESTPRLNIGKHNILRQDIPKHVLNSIRDMNRVDLEIYQFAKQHFLEQYRQFSVDVLRRYRAPSNADLYIQELLDERTNLKAQIEDLQAHNHQLAQLVNTPDTLSGLYRALVPLYLRLHINNLRRRGF